jgi:hypothetical protein
MKKLTLIFAIVLAMAAHSLPAQPRTASLQHGNSSQIFYGTYAFQQASNAAVDGDVIVLSANNFDGATITKKIKVIGSGHYPNPVNATPTNVTSIGLGSGSDSCLIEGINIGNISGLVPVRAIHISRCKIGTFDLLAGSRSCLIEGNAINHLHCGNKDTANIIANNFFSPISGDASILGFNNGSFFENNTYCEQNGIGMVNCVIRNNIIYSLGGGASWTCSGNLIQNNFVSIYNNPNGQYFDTLNNVVQNTYTGPITDIISGGLAAFNYTADYHITNPTFYLGVDATQIGIYGGLYPYKPNAIPYNPRIESKYIAPQTDVNGNFQISFKVKAQNY